MSGAFGWAHYDAPQSRPNSNTAPKDHATQYQDALRRYDSSATQGTQSVRSRKIDASRNAGTAKQVPDGLGTLQSTAANVLIVVLDVTASMREWPQEIFRRLPLLYNEATLYLGSEDVEVLFVAHGDARTDEHPVQVARFGRGAELDDILASFYRSCGGGGQGTESHELIAYKLVRDVDTSSAQNVFCWFVTDEAACDHVDSRLVALYLQGSLTHDTGDSHSIFATLRRKMHVFTILCETNSYDPKPIAQWWEKTIGAPQVRKLNDARRVVDVLLGTVATVVGKRAQFETILRTRLLPTPHGAENVETVLSAIDMVGRGTPSDPFRLPGATQTKSIL